MVKSNFETLWCKRVCAAWLRYQHATADLRQVQLQYAHNIPSPAGHFAVVKAQRTEIWALKAYCRAIQVLQEHQVYGKLPLSRD